MLLIAPPLIFQSRGKNRMSTLPAAKCNVITERVSLNFDAFAVHNEEIGDLHFYEV